MDNGIKSKDRVKDFGEVFTPDNIVNDMLDLLDEQWKDLSSEEYITKTILEPACGDGQFLIRILYRKLERVKKLHKENRPLALVKAVSSIYGVDIQSDNVDRSKRRMFNIIIGGKETSFNVGSISSEIQINLGIEITDQLKKVIEFILDNNIICGDTLKPSGDNDEVVLTVYKFNDKTQKVKLAKAPINNLDFEINESDEVNIMDMPNISTGDDGEDFDF